MATAIKNASPKTTAPGFTTVMAPVVITGIPGAIQAASTGLFFDSAATSGSGDADLRVTGVNAADLPGFNLQMVKGDGTGLHTFIRAEKNASAPNNLRILFPEDTDITGYAHVSGDLTAATAEITGLLTAGSATLSGLLTVGSAHVTGDLQAATAEISGLLTAGDFHSATAEISGLLTAGSAHVTGDLQAATVEITGLLTAGSAHVTGDLQSATAEIAGELQAASAVISGDLAAATAHFTTNAYVNGSPVLTFADLPPGGIPYPPAGIGVSTGTAWAASIDPARVAYVDQNNNFTTNQVVHGGIQALGYMGPLDVSKSAAQLGTGNSGNRANLTLIDATATANNRASAIFTFPDSGSGPGVSFAWEDDAGNANYWMAAWRNGTTTTDVTINGPLTVEQYFVINNPNPAGYPGVTLQTPGKSWQFAAGGPTSDVPFRDSFYVYDNSAGNAPFLIHAGVVTITGDLSVTGLITSQGHNLALNGNNTDGNRIGLGGANGNANLFLDAITGGGFIFRVNNAAVATMYATGALSLNGGLNVGNLGLTLNVGNSATGGAQPSIRANTTGSMFLNPGTAAGVGLYLNYDHGAGGTGIHFGNGAGADAATLDNSGTLTVGGPFRFGPRSQLSAGPFPNINSDNSSLVFNPSSSGGCYLCWDSGSTGTLFGDGAGNQVAQVDKSGNFGCNGFIEGHSGIFSNHLPDSTDFNTIDRPGLWGVAGVNTACPNAPGNATGIWAILNMALYSGSNQYMCQFAVQIDDWGDGLRWVAMRKRTPTQWGTWGYLRQT